MKNELLKTLWMLRFQKMKKSEEEAAWKYQEILDEFLVGGEKDDRLPLLLGQLVREERMHERLAEELIKLVQKNHPECSVLSS